MKHFTILNREQLLARSYGEEALGSQAQQKEVREPGNSAPINEPHRARAGAF